MLHLRHPDLATVVREDRRQREPDWLAQADAQRRARDAGWKQRHEAETARRQAWTPQLDAVRRYHGPNRRLRT